jgi:hypothetical protein
MNDYKTDYKTLEKAKMDLLEIINSAILMEQHKVEGLRKIFIWVESDVLPLEEATTAVKQIVMCGD